ncbi:hypothetical protein HDU87_004330 [Geranomyces variabilis]|uniref:Carrier domain-containing protein n=1 Tax=Geranomyces variabilis TaxID=109894 RepID=A0AAD5TJP5_9FUNG|nr:hypothetical protein HDU87_004330 [Geranomyces variabilis]
MMPSKFVLLDAFPRNVNGKTDRKRLVEMDVPLTQGPLRNNAERTLADIWAPILQRTVETMDANVSVFPLGADSMSVLRLSSAAKKAGFDITPADIFRSPTISKLAITGQAAGAPLTMAKAAEPSFAEEDVKYIYPLSPLQSGMVPALMRNPSKYLTYQVWELQGSSIPTRVQKAFDTLIAAHDILRT